MQISEAFGSDFATITDVPNSPKLEDTNLPLCPKYPPKCLKISVGATFTVSALVAEVIFLLQYYYSFKFILLTGQFGGKLIALDPTKNIDSTAVSIN